MALDVGERTVGVAVTDPTGVSAQPLFTVQRDRAGSEWARLGELCREYAVKEVVVGLPVRTQGSEGPEAGRVRAFAAELTKRTRVPVVFVDERFSTRMAEQVLLEAGLGRRRRREALNHVAAAIILEAYLARRRVRGEGRKDTLDAARDAAGGAPRGKDGMPRGG